MGYAIPMSFLIEKRYELNKKFAENGQRGVTCLGWNWYVALCERAENLGKRVIHDLSRTQHAKIAGMRSARTISDVRKRLKECHLLDFAEGRGKRHAMYIIPEEICISDAEIAAWQEKSDAAAGDAREKKSQLSPDEFENLKQELVTLYNKADAQTPVPGVNVGDIKLEKPTENALTKGFVGMCARFGKPPVIDEYEHDRIEDFVRRIKERTAKAQTEKLPPIKNLAPYIYKMFEGETEKDFIKPQAIRATGELPPPPPEPPKQPPKPPSKGKNPNPKKPKQSYDMKAFMKSTWTVPEYKKNK
jgi:hypothetical protein